MLMNTEKSEGMILLSSVRKDDDHKYGDLDRRPYERNFADPSTLVDFDVVFAGSNKKLKEAKVLQSEEVRINE
ncbi:hypothetical protein C5167_026765 [Papaver somniferum]|nr:hypothetical protein C5167_026765 [Papaver somniferum]